jgi:flagellar motor protein MotB
VAHTSAELAETEQVFAAQNVAFVSQGAALKEAQQRAAQAAADLARFATVKQEPRGMVITLSGSVLLTSAKSALSPAAELKLNQVADALVKEDPSRRSWSKAIRTRKAELRTTRTCPGTAPKRCVTTW